MNLAVFFGKKCRICAADILDIEKFVTIFSYVGLDDIVRKYLSINITKEDKLPNKICEKCITKLEDIHKLAALASKTEENFKSQLEALRTKSISINEKLTFENLINNKIITKFRSEQVCVWSQKDISIVDYDDLKVGQLIKDHEFLRLIIKALKWDVHSKPVDVQLDLLKNKNLRDILTNTNLLRDSDLIQLLKSYMGQDTFTHISKAKEETDLNLIYNGDESVTQMEVGVDPELFFPYEDQDTCSKENEVDEKELNEDSSNSCNICAEEFETNALLQEHLRTHLLKHKNTLGVKRKKSRRSRKGGTKSSQFKCVVCGKILSTKGNLKVHVDTHKPKGKYSCEKCGRIFKSIVNLLRHKEYHSEIQYSCSVCGRVYPTNSTLKAHSITHSTDRPHECPLCDKNFKRNQDLKFHINQHTGARPYQCPKCPKAFASSGNCFSHRKRMHPELMEQTKDLHSLS